MKFISNTILAAAMLSMVAAVAANSNLMQCANSSTSQVDFFPHKVEPTFSKLWNMSYHDTYKVFLNKAANKTYLLYQCGTKPPSAEMDGRHANVISIPPQAPSQNGVVVTSNPMIAYLELLGLRTDIVGYVGLESYISSPCMKELINEGRVAVAADATNATLLKEDGVPVDAVTLTNGFPADIIPNKTIIMQEYKENSYQGTMEWIKAYGAIFNLEEKANEIFQGAECRFNAVAENVASVTADMQKKPTVLWADYSSYCGGWDVAECPNYYCNFARACDAKLLNSSEGTAGIKKCGKPYMTTEEFVAFGKDAEHWIYPNSNWNDVYAGNKDVLSQFVSVQNQSVFDNQGKGEDAWFEERFADYDVVLNDFCLVAGTVVSSVPSNHRIWLRNVFTEPVGTMGACKNVSAPLEPRGYSWSFCKVGGKNTTGQTPSKNPTGQTPSKNPTGQTQSKNPTGQTPFPKSSAYGIFLSTPALVIAALFML